MFSLRNLTHCFVVEGAHRHACRRVFEETSSVSARHRPEHHLAQYQMALRTIPIPRPASGSLPPSMSASHLPNSGPRTDMILLQSIDAKRSHRAWLVLTKSVSASSSCYSMSSRLQCSCCYSMSSVSACLSCYSMSSKLPCWSYYSMSSGMPCARRHRRHRVAARARQPRRHRGHLVALTDTSCFARGGAS